MWFFFNLAEIDAPLYLLSRKVSLLSSTNEEKELSRAILIERAK